MTIAAAQVLVLNEHGAELLDWLFEKLAATHGSRCFRTEWRGFGSVIPQIGVATRPVGLTIQVDEDPEYVPAERDELAEELTSKVPDAVVKRVKLSDCRLDIMSATPNEPIITDEAIIAVGSTDLDPVETEVDDVVRELVALTGGTALDCVNGRLLDNAESAWVEL